MDELGEIRKRKMREKLSRKQGAMDRPVELTDDSLRDLITQNPLAVVDCWAPWCGPCHMMAPIIEELAKTYTGRMVFGKLDVDENPMTAKQYEIMSIPTLLIFKNGKLADRIIGAMSRQALESRITQYLQ